MKCPFCGFDDSKVIDSRSVDDRIRRRRECLSCAKRFTSYETVETLPIMVIKKDGSREIFDRGKITGGVLRACQKRPVSVEQVDRLVDEVENEIQNTMDREIASGKIGEMVMQKLKDIDEVAYVRFASVYRQFADVNTFMDELQSLLKEKKGPLTGGRGK